MIERPGYIRPSRAARGWLSGMAIAFATGIALRTSLHGWPTMLSLVTTGALTIWVLVRGSRSAALAPATTLIAATALGAFFCDLRTGRLPLDHLSVRTGHADTLVHLTGQVRTRPELKSRAAGAFAAYDHRPPAIAFDLDVNTLHTPGNSQPTRGHLHVRLDARAAFFDVGDVIDLHGHLFPPRPPPNPGTPDRRPTARATRSAGVLLVPRAEAVSVVANASHSWRGRWRRWRADLRTSIRGALRAGLWTDNREVAALVDALLIGARGDDLHDLGDAFRRVGVAHLLAISGLHVGILAALILLTLRLTGIPAPWHGGVIIVLVIASLAIIDVRLPVARAAVMTIAACLGSIGRRHLAPEGLLALSAIVLLAIRPEQLFDAGFQLSFGVVLALIHLAPILRRRWFGPPGRLAGGAVEIATEALKTSLAAAVTAWLVSTPLIMVHFGQFAPLAAPLSVLTIPIVAIVLALGTAVLATSALLPMLVAAPGLLLTAATWLLATTVRGADSIPGAHVLVPAPPTWWLIGALLWSVLWIRIDAPRHRRLLWRAGAALLLIGPWSRPPDLGAALRIDMLAVGNGSCYVLRSAGATMVYDAGSSTDPDVARRTIIPALRALGVTRVDRLIISHANLDHYCAAPELVEHFGVREIITTAAVIRATQASSSPDPAAPAHLRALLDAHDVTWTTIARGDQLRLGHAHLRCLHPPIVMADDLDANDTSIVLRIDAGGRAVLMCGDIERRAIRACRDHDPTSLQADVMELPHHGSFSNAAAALVAAADPSIVLQSTGPARWHADRWADVLANRRRFLTARDGAAWVRIGTGGTLSAGCHLPGREEPAL